MLGWGLDVGLRGPRSQFLVRWKQVPSVHKAECHMAFRRFAGLSCSSWASRFLVVCKSRCHGRDAYLFRGFLWGFPKRDTTVATACSTATACALVRVSVFVVLGCVLLP